ncbi:sulfurtransferase TusA family protein [Amphiplicatus metriothermophilus]|uniref:tRNA 2-thiouridine synthesizing protein A n=1 Tax=Amphiplicatus metriothermophilus TaxID=1519374 RepID=A0A239PJI5_9PROT|nr:sulfurtransferase TusA family protein [Amphiplicatus metriothermophilus]MBB5517720.1 tRNA 2-thiouridine synthesizing protein A [Amphiplicatus metriothermophilus]SNT67946.1 tRNA 2-thiouridine synthesizing protein A [Amphiplicatus metriothermophilus]
MHGPQEIIDLRGYRCPVPVIRLEARLRALPAGAAVRVIADDPVAAVDIPHFCRQGGHAVRRLPDEQGPWGRACVFLVTRGPYGAPAD